MAGILTKFKNSVTGGSSGNDINPIEKYFEVGRESSNVGPCLTWRVYDALRKSDGKECSIFYFDKRIAEKLYRPKKKDSMVERIKYSVHFLSKIRCPKMLQIIHSLEEANHSLAFATEPIIGCLQNILSWHESNIVPGAPQPIMPYPISLASASAQAQQLQMPVTRPPFSKEYYFLDIELRYGLLQVIEGLQYLHYTANLIHRNICPQTIIVTKKGTWKLFGLEYSEPLKPRTPTKAQSSTQAPQAGTSQQQGDKGAETDEAENDVIELVPVPPWTVKLAKLVQPNLDYMAPESQTSGYCCILSDMFSLGLVICAIFNNGKPLIQANNNACLYMKQIEFLDRQYTMLKERVPYALQEAVQRLLVKDPYNRATTRLLPLIKYFKGPCEPIIATMQYLDIVIAKNPSVKGDFYCGQLMNVLPYIPKKLRWQFVWQIIRLELRTTEMLPAALVPTIWLASDATVEEFDAYILPIMKSVMDSAKHVESATIILKNMHKFLKENHKTELTNEMLTMLYTAMDSNSVQFELQTSSLIALQNVHGEIDDKDLHTIVLPKVKTLLAKNPNDVKVIGLILGLYEKVLLRLERGHILELVIPTVLAMRINDPGIVNRVVQLYKSMLLEKKFELASNVMATKMIPSLAPQTVNPGLNIDQFSNLMEILYDMLDNIDRTQRQKFKLENANMSSYQRYRALRNQKSTDNVNAPPFSIPNLRVEKRKTSSAEDMARKNSISGPAPTGSVGGFKSTGLGQWFFGSNNSGHTDSNFLRVVSSFPGRRLSDNTLMTPKIRIGPSCASSPGGTPGTSGLPTRRHSSIGPQERRGSAVNLSPPRAHQATRGRTGGSGSSLSVPSTSQNVGGSMPNTSSSAPFLPTSSMQSVRSRRPSAASQGSGLIQQLSTGMYQLFSGRT